MKNARQYNQVYTHVVNVVANQPNNGSSPIFFKSGNDVLSKVTVKAIEFSGFGLGSFALGNAPWYVTFVNDKEESLIFNYPIKDFVTYEGDPFSNGGNKLRLFNLPNINLNKSYWFVASGVGWGASLNIFNINFYY